MQQEISSPAQGEMNKSQREYFLRQQLSAIQKELGEGEEMVEEIENCRKKIDEPQMPERGRRKGSRTDRAPGAQHPFSAETAIIRTYLDWMTELPWGVETEDRLDLDRARKILDDDHYGLEKVKERIVEYLAVRKLRGQS